MNEPTISVAHYRGKRLLDNDGTFPIGKDPRQKYRGARENAGRPPVTAGGGDPGTASGSSVPGGAALVAGAGVTAVHIRGVFRTELMGPGWAIGWGTFLWVALTAGGPFVYLVRAYLRPDPSHPR